MSYRQADEVNSFSSDYSSELMIGLTNGLTNGLTAGDITSIRVHHHTSYLVT